MNHFLRLFILVIFSAAASIDTYSQTLKFFDVDKSQFPILKGKFYAFDAAQISQKPVHQDLTIRENGVSMPILSVVCPPDPDVQALSSVIMVDISGSMSTVYSTFTGLELAKTAATAWVNGLPKGLSEAAIGSFNDLNYINIDFTESRQALLSTLATLQPTGGTNYDKGLLEPFAGALQLSKNAKYKKVIIYITDGLPNFEPNIQAIIQEAKSQECTIFAITLGLPCPTSLRQITAQTGGAYFENVTTFQEAQTLYLSMLKTSQMAEACEIVWQSKHVCTENTQTATLEWNGVSQSSNYTLEISRVSSLNFQPQKMLFSTGLSVGKPHDTTLQVTAKGSDFRVKNITSSESSFDIFPKQFTLKAGESKTLTVRYTPRDSSYYWSEFTFDTDICPQEYYAAARFSAKRSIPQKSTIQLSYPNGEEVLVAGGDTKIRWNGIPATDQVLLEVSSDNAASWQPIARNASGLEYPWRIPKNPGSQYRVRVVQSLEKPAEVTNDTVSCLGHTDCIRKVLWSPDGTKVLTAGMDGNAIIWNAQDGSMVHTLSSKYSAITHCEWSPNGKYIVTAGTEDSIFIWEAATGAKIKALLLYVDKTSYLTWNHAGNTLLICSNDGSIIFWNHEAETYSRYSFLSGVDIITAAQWSPDDKEIVLCTENLNTAIIWSTITSQERLRLSGHTKNVRHAAWSPDGRYIATGGGDKIITVSEASTGKIQAKLIGHSQLVTEVAWSPDGAYLASASDDLTSCVWDPINGSRLLELVGHTGILTHVEWNPNGTQLATSSGDNTARVWDAYTGTQEKLVRQNGYLTHLSWSPNGKRLATSGCDFNAVLWNVNPAFIPFQTDMSDTVFSIVAPTPLVLDIDMGQLSVGSSKDTVIAEFLRNTGTYPYRVDSIALDYTTDVSEFTLVNQHYPIEIKVGEHRFGEFLFHPTSAGLKSARIIIYTQAEIITRTITGVGIIDSVEIQGVPIGFGKVDVGTDKDVKNGYVIINHSSSPVQMSIAENGPNNDAYSLIDQKTNHTLNPGQSVSIDVRFSPKNLGRTGGGLTFDFHGKRSPVAMQLFGEGVPNSPLLAMNYSINMGKVTTGEQRDSMAVVMVLNKSSNVITLSSIEIRGTNPDNFKVLNNGVLTLQPQEKLLLDIRFAPKSTGNKYAELVMTPQGGGDAITMTLIGNGVEGAGNSNPATATLLVGSVSGKAGDTISIPIRMIASKNLFASKAREFRGILECNAAALSPVGVNSVVTAQNGVNSFAFSFPILTKDTQIIYSFQVLPNTDSLSEVQLRDVYSVGGKVTLTTEKGTFRFLPSKRDTSGTGKDTTGTGKPGVVYDYIQLGPLSPNPVGNTSELTIRLIEKGKTLVQIIDMSGRIVKTLLQQDMPIGLITLHVDARDIGVGTYFIDLQTPTQRRLLQMEVMR